MYLDTGAAPPRGMASSYTSPRPSEALCEEHFPYDFGGRKTVARLKGVLQQIRGMTFDGNVRQLVDEVLDELRF